MKRFSQLVNEEPVACAAMLVSVLVLLAGCAAILPQPGTGGVLSSAVIASIPVGDGPTLLAMSRDGSRVYAANSKLSVISTASNRVAASISMAPYPTGLAVTPDDNRAFVTNLFSVKLAVVDLKVSGLLTPIELFTDRVVGGFGRITLTSDGRTAYVVNAPNEAMAIADVGAPDVSSLMMDMQPFDTAVARDGGTVYVAGCRDFCASGTIEVLDARSRHVTGSITVGSRPYRILLSPDGRRAYTSNLGDPSVSVVDLAADRVVATVPVPVQPTGLAVSDDGTHLFVASQPTGTVTVIEVATNMVQATAKVARNVREIVATPDGRRLYVSTQDSVIAVDVGLLR